MRKLLLPSLLLLAAVGTARGQQLVVTPSSVSVGELARVTALGPDGVALIDAEPALADPKAAASLLQFADGAAFAARAPGTYQVVAAIAVDGKPRLLRAVVLVEGPAPPPKPPEPPKPPGPPTPPAPPVVPTQGLAKVAYDAGKPVGDPAGAAIIAGAYRAVASKLVAGGFPGEVQQQAQGAVDEIGNLLRERLPDRAAWQGAIQIIGTAQQSTRPANLAELAEGFKDIAEGLEAIR